MPQDIKKNKNEPVETARKRLIFRSWHRGTREIDLLLGRFADVHVPEFDGEALALYDKLLENDDPDIYNWVTGAEDVPDTENSEVLKLLVEFYRR